MSGQLHSVHVDRLVELGAGEHVDVAPSPSGLSLSAQVMKDVWIAYGLRRRWRVVSEYRTYGEWDDEHDARRFLVLLVAGNPNLRRLA